MWYTVVYTHNLGYAGTLVCTESVQSNQLGELFAECEAIGIDPCAIVHVFEGKHESIESDWSKL